MATMHGIVLGGAYGGIAMGLSMVFGVSRVTNFAHGALLMMSTFMYYELHTRFGINPYLGILFVTPIMFLLGYAVQALLITPLLKRERGTVSTPISLLLITIGLGFAIENLYMMIYRSTFRTIPTTAGISNFVWQFGGGRFVISWARIYAFLACFVIAGVLWFVINRSELGKRIRAVSQNRDAAAICGVDVYRTYGITFGMAMASVGVAGACLSAFLFVQPQVGIIFGIRSFMIVVLGGLGSIPGALIGGFIFGIVETVGALYMSASAASMLTFLLFIVFLLVKPNGLMGKN